MSAALPLFRWPVRFFFTATLHSSAHSSPQCLRVKYLLVVSDHLGMDLPKNQPYSGCQNPECKACCVLFWPSTAQSEYHLKISDPADLQYLGITCLTCKCRGIQHLRLSPSETAVSVSQEHVLNIIAETLSLSAQQTTENAQPKPPQTPFPPPSGSSASSTSGKSGRPFSATEETLASARSSSSSTPSAFDTTARARASFASQAAKREEREKARGTGGSGSESFNPAAKVSTSFATAPYLRVVHIHQSQRSTCSFTSQHLSFATRQRQTAKDTLLPPPYQAGRRAGRAIRRSHRGPPSTTSSWYSPQVWRMQDATSNQTRSSQYHSVTVASYLSHR